MSSFKQVWKISKYIACAIIFSIALSGCTLTGKKQTTDADAKKIVVWSFEEEDVWKQVIKDFQNQAKDYAITYEKQTFDANYENRVLNSMLAGQGPDVWAMPNDWVYRHKEKLYPMPDSLAKTVNLDNQYVPSVKQSVLFDNKIYALTPSVEPLMVFYNYKMFDSRLAELKKSTKDKTETDKYNSLLKEVPKTWTDFAEAANFLTIKNGENITTSGVVLGTANIANASDILYFLMAQNETDILTADYSLATFNLPKNTATGENDTPGQRALEFYASFADPNSQNYTWSDSLGNDLEAFGAGKAAMILGYSSLQNYLAQKYPNLQYKKAFMPQVDQDSEKITDFARFTAFGVNRLSKNPGAAWTLVNTLGTKSSNAFSSATKTYTSKKQQGINTSITKRTGNSPEKTAVAIAKTLVKGRYPIEFDRYIRAAAENVNDGNQDPKSALDLAASTITELLRKKDW